MRPILYGDVMILSHQAELERYAYSQYKNDMDSFLWSLRSDVIEMPKRKQYDFGEILFHSDAKLQDYHTKLHETTSLEEQCSIYELENTELKKQIKEYSQHNADKQQIAEALRAECKRNELLQKEIENLKAKLEESAAESYEKEAAYRRSAELVLFYKEQVDIAASFPTDKDSVCQWIDDSFSGQLIVSQRARSEMKKFNGPLDIAGLCDGILFLSAYVRFRRREISEDTLKLYAERNNCEVQNCGKEALKMRKQDYTFLHNDKQYLLDLHIKRGVSAQEFIRVYFCWNDALDKLIIGSMPDHLATKNYK